VVVLPRLFWAGPFPVWLALAVAAGARPPDHLAVAVGPVPAAAAEGEALGAGMGHLVPCKVKGCAAGELVLGLPPTRFVLAPAARPVGFAVVLVVLALLVYCAPR
jgi:hypothetical protein